MRRFVKPAILLVLLSGEEMLLNLGADVLRIAAANRTQPMAMAQG